MNSKLDSLREVYAFAGRVPETLYTSLNITHKQRNDVYADFVRKEIKPETADVLWENQEYMNYLATILSSTSVPDFMYSKAVAMLYNSHRTVLPVVGREHLEALYRQKLDCLRVAFKELKKHPNKAGMKVRDIKDTRELIEEELNDLLAKQDQNVK